MGVLFSLRSFLFLTERNGISIVFVFIDFYISRFLSQWSRCQNRTSGGWMVINILTCINVFECRYTYWTPNTPTIQTAYLWSHPFSDPLLSKHLARTSHNWQDVDRLQRDSMEFHDFWLDCEIEKKQSKRGNKNLLFSKVLRRIQPAAINLMVNNDTVFAAD